MQNPNSLNSQNKREGAELEPSYSSDEHSSSYLSEDSSEETFVPDSTDSPEFEHRRSSGIENVVTAPSPKKRHRIKKERIKGRSVTLDDRLEAATHGCQVHDIRFLRSFQRKYDVPSDTFVDKLPKQPISLKRDAAGKTTLSKFSVAQLLCHKRPETLELDEQISPDEKVIMKIVKKTDNLKKKGGWPPSPNQMRILMRNYGKRIRANDIERRQLILLKSMFQEDKEASKILQVFFAGQALRMQTAASDLKFVFRKEESPEISKNELLHDKLQFPLRFEEESAFTFNTTNILQKDTFFVSKKRKNFDREHRPRKRQRVDKRKVHKKFASKFQRRKGGKRAVWEGPAKNPIKQEKN